MALCKPRPRGGKEYPTGGDSVKSGASAFRNPPEKSSTTAEGNDPDKREDKWKVGKPPADKKPLLPKPSEKRGVGDILYGLDPDPDSDPVEKVQDLRR